MASLTSDSILLNPLPEIIAALTSSSFGILPAPDSQPLLEQTFPRTAEELKSVQEESNRSRKMSERVVGMCRVGLLDGEGHVVIRLDRAGWTIETADGERHVTNKIGTTYESMESLLISASRKYVEAMNREIWKRFEGHPQAVEERG
ncbi:hypothetical protein C347_03001 [Cryptococcus neoformans AD2-60a]|nr:hypothetical protein C347_03001 [Cryptococcus neoformans var. grubii AD2-60a]OWZ44939.1 hypothetical protein C353_02842 [Cryptococcus neoformans var. grubii AD1-83a]OWZ57830.1 hypothetical protein C368_01000 [Cryptococcus neoformans var. grubii 125.91]OWZ61283.1 hypothetical protein AYX15_06510 [Cryptococcus neoformans var. grubii]OWZ78210.1 hypothetical protein C365_03003 [Cryptococcus neoformans var. grubii Bt85]OXC84987.1 hypothetical protein C344_02699 [Cryptococcus neoformans var. grub